MRGRIDRRRNVRAVVASAAVVTLLVAGALSWLGWRLLSQEQAIEQQRRWERLEQVADGRLAALLRSLSEAEAGLAQVESAPPWRLPDPPSGAIAVLLSPANVVTKPPVSLVYTPLPPPASHIDYLVFQESERLEFHDKDYAAAEAALRRLTGIGKAGVVSEARLRLGRIQTKSGHLTDALNTYNALLADSAFSSAEVPYALLARFERCRLLAQQGRRGVLEKEATDLLGALASGQWPILKDAYAYYAAETNRLIGRSGQAFVADTALPVAEVIESLWEAWQSGTPTRFRAPPRRVYGSAKRRTLVLVNSTSERVAALLYPDAAIRQLLLGAGWSFSPSDSIVALLVDEQGEILQGVSPSHSAQATSRSLAAAQIPWSIRVAMRDDDSSHGLFTGRKQGLAFGLAVIIGLVALACYAMARGVIRELSVAQLQTDFISAVSHEFRSPLTTLLQLTELLACGRIHDENRRTLYFDVLHKETARLHALVENLLDFGRMESGRTQYRPESIILFELVREVVRQYQGEIGGAGFAFELTGTAGPPLQADREALRRLVRNLLENAVKYSPECRTVWIEIGEEDGNAVLRVRDRGMGIEPHEQASVFDKFVRGSAAKQACIQGTGIGLAMVKETVKVHRGEVHLDSAVGLGSTFTVRLPLCAAGVNNDKDPGSGRRAWNRFRAGRRSPG